jgi:hypothetical protein
MPASGSPNATLATPVHRLIAHPGTGDRHQSERLLAFSRNDGSASAGARNGAFANGEKDRDEAPTGANLRTARLDAAALKKVISCGKPGAEMPAFNEKAATCGGETGLYPTPRNLTSDEIDLVIAYLQARIVGRGRITKAECLAYYDGQEDMCSDFQ